MTRQLKLAILFGTLTCGVVFGGTVGPLIQVIGPNWAPLNTSRAVNIIGAGYSATTTCDIAYFGGVAPLNIKDRPAASGLPQALFPCTSVSGNRITATVPGNSFTASGAVTLQTLGAGSAGIAYNARATGPALTALSVNSKVVGSGSFVLGLTGTFDSTAQVFFLTPGSSPVQLTLFNSPTPSALQVTVPGSLLQSLSNSFIYVVINVGTVASFPLVTELLPFNVVAPSITSLNPSSTVAGSGNTTLTLNGAFPGANGNAANVTFTPPIGNAVALTPTTATESQLTVTIPSASLAASGSAGVVANVLLTPVSSSSNSATFTITSPTPIISSVTPNPIARNAPTTVFTINGSNFAPGSQSATFTPPGGSATSVSITNAPTTGSMTVSVPSNLLTAVGTGSFRVTTTAGPSGPGDILIAAPVISSVTPSSVLRGAAATSITIAGSNFLVGGSPVVFFTPPGGSAVTLTQTVSPGNTSITATIPAAQMLTAGTATILVQSGTADSGAVSYLITAPVISQLNPNSVAQNSATTSVNIVGSGFAIGSTTATWIPPAGSPTTPLSGSASSTTLMTVSVPNTLLTVAGTAQIFVTTGTASSNSANFAITAPTPTLTTANPSRIAVNTTASITLTGTNLSPLTSITFTPPGGSAAAVTPTSASATSIVVPVSSTSAGTGTFTVLTGGGSATRTIAIAAPTISLLTPSTAVAGAGNTSLGVGGADFLLGSPSPVVQFLPPGAGAYTDLTPFGNVLNNNLDVTIPQALLTTPGNALVRVRSGNAFSTDATFTITAPPVAIEFVSPSTQFEGSSTVTVLIFGSGFTTNGSPTVRWTNGANTQNLTIVGTPGNTTLNVTIPASLLAVAGSATIVVQVGQVNSNPSTFTIIPSPVISSLTPSSANAGSPAFTMTINGANLIQRGYQSTVRFNTTDLVPTGNANGLTVTVPAALIATAGVFPVTVTFSQFAAAAPSASRASASSGRLIADVGNTSNIANFTVNGAGILTSLNPSQVGAGGPAFNLTLNGSGFTLGDVVDFNGSSIIPTSITATQITALIPASAIATPGSRNVRVVNNVGIPSNVLPLRVNFTITSLNPSVATTGGPLFPLTVTAPSGILSGTQINFNGTLLPTTGATATSVTANVPANLIATTAVVPVTITDGVLTSNFLNFSILGAVNISSLNPTFAQAGGSTFPLAVLGSGFDALSTVLANGSPLTSSFVNAGQMTATIPASLIATADNPIAITVRDGNGRVSNAVNLPVLAPITLTSLNPSFAQAGAAALLLTVNGGGFDSTMTVLANGSALTSTFVTASQMTATVPASVLATAGTVTITVSDTRGRTSNGLPFAVLEGLTISSLAPAFRESGTADFTLIVNGTGFDGQSVVLSNGSTTLTTSFVSATQLQASVPASLVASPGSVSITVRDARSRTSNAVSLPVISPIVITSLSPNLRDAGSAAFTLVVNGSGFESVAVIRFNGTALATNFVNANQVSATVPANLIASAANVNVTVSDNRGRTSAPASFLILSPLSITSLSPPSVEVGSATFTLTLIGAGFANGLNVLFGGNSIAATVATSTQASVQIPASLVASVATIPVSAQIANSAFREGASGLRTSNTLNFDVLTSLRLTSLSPSRANAGVPTFTLVVTGQGFTNGGVIRFNNTNLTTTFVNSTTLSGLVTAGLLPSPGSVEVSVQLPDGRIALPLPFVILPQLRITSINPGTAAAGANTFTMTVTGEGFTTESVVRFGGFGLPTTFVSSTQLTVIFSDSIIANPTSGDITVANPLNAISNAISFSAGGTITVTSINPPGAAAGSNAVTLAISGTGFTPGTVARFGSTDLATTFVSNTQLNAIIPAALLVTPGNFGISAAAGATVSNSVNFEVGGKPELNFINPDAVTAGSRGITIIAVGRGFLPGATLKFGDADLPTTFVSGTQVSAVVSADLLVTARTVAVSVVNANSQASNSKDFRIAALTITLLTPDKATAGGAAFTLAVQGTGFINGAIISFGGRSLITTFGGATGVSGQVPANAILTAGSINVTVSNPDGAVSNALPFVIESDSPTISRLNPNSVIAGSGEVSIAVIGGGFVRGSSVTANGNGLSTTFNSSTSLDAVIPADLTLNIRNLVIKVVNPGNKESNELGLAVTAPTPAITSINPASVNAGSTVDVAITIAGSGFLQGSSVTFNGSGIETSFGSATSLSAVIPASALVNSGNAAIQVVNPGNLQSNTVQFNILGAVTVTSVNPTSLAAGGAADPVITVAGTGFVSGSTVLFGGASLPTTFGSATQLTATVPQNLLTTARTVSVSVRNPNGAVSNGVNLQVTPPVPALNLNVPATLTPAGNGRVLVSLSAPAPVALQGTLSMTFLNNSNNAPNGYFDPALGFAGGAPGQPRVVSFSIPLGGTAAVILGDGAFSPGTVAGTITIVMTSLTGGGQNLLPNSAPTGNVLVDRSVPVVVAGSVRITNIAGGFQVELSGISSPRDLSRITYTFTASGTSILEGASVPVDVTQLFTTFFASDAGRASGGTFRFTMPFTVSGGDAAAVSQVTVTMTNSVGTSQVVSGGR